MYSIIDDALPSGMYGDLCDYARNKAEFGTIKNTVDSVEYPLICRDIPDQVKGEIERMTGSTINTIFMRLSPAGVHVPHIAHNDTAMGKKSVILYMFTANVAGTAFLEHVEGGGDIDMMMDDCNDMTRWTIEGLVPAIENRALIFDSEMMHAAIPVGGFGDNQSNSRLVLTAFLD